MDGSPSERFDVAHVLCPFGLERSPQGLETILAKLNLPRGLVSTQLFLALLKGHASSQPLDRHVKICTMVKDVFGEKYGAQVPMLVHMERCPALREDTRTKLSCTWDCHSCTLCGNERLRVELQRVRDIVT
jgi:predicted component of type VI protein secretion system